jgi:hypothetical protein
MSLAEARLEYEAMGRRRMPGEGPRHRGAGQSFTSSAHSPRADSARTNDRARDAAVMIGGPSRVRAHVPPPDP